MKGKEEMCGVPIFLQKWPWERLKILFFINGLFLNLSLSSDTSLSLMVRNVTGLDCSLLSLSLSGKGNGQLEPDVYRYHRMDVFGKLARLYAPHIISVPPLWPWPSVTWWQCCCQHDLHLTGSSTWLCSRVSPLVNCLPSRKVHQTGRLSHAI